MTKGMEDVGGLVAHVFSLVVAALAEVGERLRDVPQEHLLVVAGFVALLLLSSVARRVALILLALLLAFWLTRGTLSEA